MSSYSHLCLAGKRSCYGRICLLEVLVSIDLDCAGITEDPALSQVRSFFMQTQQAEMQAVKDHFQEALAAEQQALLSDIEHMHA